MKQFSIVLATLLLLTSLSLADKGYYLEQKVYTSGVMGQPAKEFVSKLWMAENRFRNESEGQVSIFRFDLKKVWMIHLEKKQYSEMSLDEIKQMAQMGKAMMQNVQEQEYKFRKTNNTKKINQWNCYEVVAEGGMMKQTLWLSEDLPYGKDVYYNFYKDLPEFQEMAESIYNSEELKGFPVASETEMNMMGMKIKSRSELITIKEENIPGSIFELPQGLEKIESPLQMRQEHNKP